MWPYWQPRYFLALLTTFGVAASAKAGFLLQQKAADLGSADAMFELYITGLGWYCLVRKASWISSRKAPRLSSVATISSTVTPSMPGAPLLAKTSHQAANSVSRR